MRYLLFIFFLPLIVSCQKDGVTDIPADLDVHKEVAEGIVMYYSDSAQLKTELRAPVRFTYRENNRNIEEYPDGLLIKHFDKDKKVTSSITAKYAKWNTSDRLMQLRDSVVMTNLHGDKITTTGILWDEAKHTLRTSKFVQLVRPSEQDTLYGFGFYALEDFSQFGITQMTGKARSTQLTREIGLEEE